MQTLDVYRALRRASLHPLRTTFHTLLCSLMMLGLLHGTHDARAQQKETSVPLSQRMTINLSAGMPQSIGNAASGSNAPQSQWWYENSQSSATYASTTFVESSDTRGNWQQVGLPYDANVTRTFINQASGGGQGSLTGNDNWYRLHFKVDPKYAGQKFLLDLEGTHTGVQVYVNGTLLPGISQVAADAKATHVIGFVPVVVDLTPYLHADGTTDNVIAVDVSRGSAWFEQPNFSGAFRFGQAMAGLFRNVILTVTNPVHIPLNVYSNTKTWGTYVGTVSEVPAAQGTATAASAVVEVQTNVLNESANDPAGHADHADRGRERQRGRDRAARHANRAPDDCGEFPVDPAGHVRPADYGREPDPVVSEQLHIRQAIYVSRVPHRQRQRRGGRCGHQPARHPHAHLGRELSLLQRSRALPLGRFRTLRLSRARLLRTR